MYVRTYIHTYLHTYIRTYVLSYIHTYVHTYVRTYMHTYIHTYVHTYVRTYLRAAAPAADPGSKYGGLATFGDLLKQGNSLYQLKKHTQLHPASRRFRGAIFEEAGPLGIGILLVQQVAKCS